MTYRKKSVNGLSKLSGLNGYAKYLPVLALAAVLTALAVSSFCTHTPESCADGQELKPGMFCFDNKAYKKCGGSEYIPYTQFCSDAGAVHDKCNGDDYDPLREFCSGNKVVPKCGGGGDGGAAYNPETQGCVNGIVKSRCGNNHYDSINEFCFNNIRIYDKCNGRAFDPTSENCAGETVKPKCGTGHYDLDTQFCYNNIVYPKCNGNEYNIANSFCYNNTIYPKCGENAYDPSRQSCNGASVVDIAKCGGVEYDGGVSFCYNNTIYAKCGGQAYDPSSKSCNGTNIVDIVGFTVYFNANGGLDGSDPPTTMKADSGKVIRLPGQQTMSMEGYSFGGWNTNAAGTGIRYSANSDYTVTMNVILYAMWTYTLTTNVSPAGGGSVIREPNWDSYLKGTNVTVTAVTESGYMFSGWSGASASTNASVTITMNGDKTLTANIAPFQVGTFTDNRNGKTYKTVTINDKKWLAENLNYQTPDSSWCYENSESYCITYGRLYAWNAARSACPIGWHLSTSEDWEELTKAVGGEFGRKLKSTNGWASDNGTDGIGFSALPGGRRWPGVGLYGYVGDYGYWWTAMQYNQYDAYYRYTRGNYNDLPGSYDSQSYGLSVRCVEGEALILSKVEVKNAGTNATESGNYAAGAMVNISAGMAPSGIVFKNWTTTSANVTFANANSAATTFTMPAKAVTVTANWQTTSDVGGSYKTVIIGWKTWMAENLNIETADSWCYNNSPDSCAKYGRLYTWSAAKTACPSGWHLPSRDEWDHLAESADGRKSDNYSTTNHNWHDAGKALKSTSGWYNNDNGTDTYGFSALPGGVRYSSSTFSNAGNSGNWWTATEYSIGNAYYRSMTNTMMGEGNINKNLGYSVRCLKD